MWNPKVHYRIHKCPPPLPILSELYAVHTPTSHFLKSILILSSHLRLVSQVIALRFPYQNVYASRLFHTRYMPRPSHYSRFYHPNNTGEECRSLCSHYVVFGHTYSSKTCYLYSRHNTGNYNEGNHGHVNLHSYIFHFTVYYFLLCKKGKGST